MARGNNPGDSRRYYDWLTYAEADIMAANDLKSNERTLLCGAFHAQQAIEKTLKAYFLFDRGYAPDGHNVIYLCRKLSRQYKEFSQWVDECAEANGYYIETRYPPDVPVDITEEKLEKLIDAAVRLYTFTFLKIRRELGE